MSETVLIVVTLLTVAFLVGGLVFLFKTKRVRQSRNQLPSLSELKINLELASPYDSLAKAKKTLLAIQKRWPVTFSYSDKEGNETSRTVLPLSLDGKIMLAWCYLRNGQRHFHLERIMNIKIHPQAEVTDLILPSFDLEPRRDTIIAAAKNHWKMDIVYINLEGTECILECDAPNLKGVNRQEIFFITIKGEGGVSVPLDRIKSINVRAAQTRSRERYRVID